MVGFVRVIVAVLLICAFLAGMQAPVLAAFDGGMQVAKKSGKKRKKKRKRKKKKVKKKKTEKADAAEAEDEEAELEEVDEDAPMFKDDLSRTRTILLDLNPVNTTKQLTRDVYRAILERIKEAEDLGYVYGREVFGERKRAKRIIRTCRGMDNTICLKKYGRATQADFAIYGDLRDLDDTFLLYMEMLDLHSGKVLESVRVQIQKPVKDDIVVEQSSSAACRLTRLYGCKENKGEAIAAPVPVATPGADDEDIIEQAEPEPEEEVEEEPEGKGPFFADEEASKKSEMSGLGITGWVLTAFSAAALAGGAATTVLMIDAKNKYDGAKDEQTALNEKQRAQTMLWTSVGLYAAGGAMLAGGVTCLVLDAAASPGSGGGDFYIMPAIGPDGTIALTGRF